jgi:hypothetical protein
MGGQKVKVDVMKTYGERRYSSIILGLGTKRR